MHIHRLALLCACSLLAHAVSTSAQTVATDLSRSARPQLLVDTTAPCTLKVNGTADVKVLVPGAPRPLDVGTGDASIECTSITTPEAVVRQSTTIAANAQPASLTLDVAGAIVSTSCKKQPATLVDLGNGVLRHCVTGADWTQQDSGPGGMMWADAVAYCAKKGNGWVLPEPDELAELIDRISHSQTQCGKHTCYVSSKFRFDSPIFWSNLKTHEGMHMIVNLILGGRHPTADDANFEYHTLCIRRPAAPLPSTIPPPQERKPG